MKECYEMICHPLLHIFNRSFETGIFPNSLKIAIITPIHKKEDKNIFTNYRPVSVLPVFSKMLEKLMHHRLLSFVDRFEILYTHQFGFREKRSTSLAILTFVEKLRKAIDTGEFGLGIFLDFSKAFDTIDHGILLQKLDFYGIRGVANDLMKSYLTGRKQKTKYNDTLSDQAEVTCGVPQGSVIGPLFFILYINDIYLTSPQLFFVLFADDTNVLLTGKNLQNLQQIAIQELKHIEQWLVVNRLSLNIAKTKVIIFSSPNKPCNRGNVKIYLGGKLLKKVESTEFLGVTVDQHLSWKKHIAAVHYKTSRVIGILYKTKSLLGKRAMLTVYFSLIYSYLNYCNLVWGGVAKTNINCLHIIQKKISRIATNNDFGEHAAPLLQQLKILNIFDIHLLNCAEFVYKWINNINGFYRTIFSNYFQTHQETHRYNTRNKGQLLKTKFKNKYGKVSITCAGAEVWNNIDPEIRDSKSIGVLKSRIKAHLLKDYV